jgi:DNA-directed RNA polymerase subunit K/omega
VRVPYVSLVVLSVRGAFVIQRPAYFGKFEFVVIAALRASQLKRGCLPRVGGDHTVAVTAQLEVAQGKVPLAPTAPVGAEDAPPPQPDPGER